MTALVIAEHDHGALKSATLHTIAAAQKVGGDSHVLVAGHNAAGAAQEAASIAGVAKVLHADAMHLAGQTAENLAALAVSLAAPYSHLFLPATGFGKNAAPRIAALLDVAQVSEIISVEAPDTYDLGYLRDIEERGNARGGILSEAGGGQEQVRVRRRQAHRQRREVLRRLAGEVHG